MDYEYWATRKSVIAAVKRLGALLTKEPEALYIDAPVGYHWKAKGYWHRIIISSNVEITKMWKQALELVHAGVEPCPPDCTCKEKT